MSIYDELAAQGRSGTRLGYTTQRRTVRWVALSKNRLALENTLIGSAAAGVGPPFIPRCHRVDWVEEVLPGLSMVTAHFESVPWPGEAYVTIHFWPYGEKLRYDVDGKPINAYGITPSDGAYEYRQTLGEKIKSSNRLVVGVHTSFYAPDWHGFLGGIDCVNATPLLNLSKIVGTQQAREPGVWRLLGPEAGGLQTRIRLEKDLVFHDYYFGYDQRGWNNLVTARRFAKVVREVLVVDQIGVAIDATTRVQDWLPIKKNDQGQWVLTEDEPRKIYPEYGFGVLDSWIVL